jgi:hypothetical protein
MANRDVKISISFQTCNHILIIYSIRTVCISGDGIGLNWLRTGTKSKKLLNSVLNLPVPQKTAKWLSASQPEPAPWNSSVLCLMTLPVDRWQINKWVQSNDGMLLTGETEARREAGLVQHCRRPGLQVNRWGAANQQPGSQSSPSMFVQRKLH